MTLVATGQIKRLLVPLTILLVTLMVWCNVADAFMDAHADTAGTIQMSDAGVKPVSIKEHRGVHGQCSTPWNTRQAAAFNSPAAGERSPYRLPPDAWTVSHGIEPEIHPPASIQL